MMESVPVRDFDLAATLDSGQVFHWHQTKRPDGTVSFIGVIGDTAVEVIQKDANTLLVSAGRGTAVTRYFALDHDMVHIHSTLPEGDECLRAALAYSPGLRIMRQPKWECLATFITSSLKQVPHIRQISLRLRERFGVKLDCGARNAEVVFHSYPSPRALADAGEKALRECGLGYRAKFLHKTACLIADGSFDLEHVAALDDEAALAKLCELPGVGPKIAQCTLLFSYERLGMFPIDVWIERMLRELYFARARRKRTPRELADFARDHFGPYRGYAQQWLFHHARVGRVLAARG